MLDAEYFRSGIKDQVQRMKRNASIIIHLHDGSAYYLRTVEDVRDGYVLLELYPEGKAEVLPARDEYDSEIRLANSSRIALPYESIREVEVTTEVPGKPIRGFAER